jgi:hypothetical protein
VLPSPILRRLASTKRAGEVRPGWHQKAFYFSYPLVEGLFESLDGTLRLSVIALEAFSGSAPTALSGCGLFSGVSLCGRHGALLRFVWVFCGGSLPKRTQHMLLASVRVECSLRNAPLVLPAFFCHPCAV